MGMQIHTTNEPTSNVILIQLPPRKRSNTASAAPNIDALSRMVNATTRTISTELPKSERKRMVLAV
jgi:hypothetical protein